MDQIEVAKDFSYRIGFSGYSGHLTVEPCPPVDRCSPRNSVPDFILPPAFLRETPESIEKFIETEYLSPRVDPEEFTPENVGKYWEFDWFHKAKICPEVSISEYAVLPMWELPYRRTNKEAVQQKWNPSSVEMDVCGFQNQSLSHSHYGGGVSSSNFTKGSSRSQPFSPGGLEGSQYVKNTFPTGATNGEWARQVINGSSVESVPCGFRHGLDLGGLKAHMSTWTVNDQSEILQKPVNKPNELSVQLDDLFKTMLEEDVSEESLRDELAQTVDMPSVIPESECSSLDDSLSVEFREFQQIAQVNGQKHHKMSWATTEDGREIANHFNELVPDMAISFPFELDTFQKQAIFYIERGDSVFVAAHTSAGKTVVAEYAFALASKHCTRAVYTAPIKTISNQKYRDFCEKFDVGLLTGDVSLRPEASCLIMTTEILRSMLYKGVDIIRDIEWVIFDEVHYVNDVERGVVWEEVIIMLPSHINIVLLSATVPNTMEFADWIGRTKKKKIFVTGTIKRPVPLEHCIFYSGELYKICESEIFMPLGLKSARDKYNKKNLTLGGANAFLPGSSSAGDGSHVKSHENMMREKHAKTSAFKKHGKQFPALNGGPQNISNDKKKLSVKTEAHMWKSLIFILSKKDLLPVVIFCFSKNRCDISANNLYGINLTTTSEKSKIHAFCEKAFSRLNGSDKNLPQVVRVQILLQRGIGVHHAGLLPIVKEVVEMIFCQGLVKVLFSTETFAMGVNAPARTVVFDSLRKFDGREFRQLLPGEYTQMAGRAGRRGIDKLGSVVTMCRDGIPEESDLKQVIVGTAKKLESQFRLTYIMILHLLRIEELQVEDMLKRSFAEFHAQKNLPEKEQLLFLKLSQPMKAVECIKGEPQIEEYYDICSQVENHFSSVTDMVMQSSLSQSFLTPGRVVVLKSDSDHSLGVVLKSSASNNSKQYIVLSLISDSAQIVGKNEHAGIFGDKMKDFSQGYVLMPKQKRGLENEYYFGSSSKGSGIINIKLPYFGSAASSNYVVKEIDTVEFLYICKCKIMIDVVGLLENCNDAAYSKAVQQLLNLQLSDAKYPPALDPLKDLKLKDINVVDSYNKQNKLLQKMANNKCHGCIKLSEHMNLAKDLQKHKEEVKMLRFQMSDQALQQMPELYGRIDVLKQIGCIDDNLVVQMKGRVACGMNSGEELICTECLFENHLEGLEPEEAVAIMSAFVFQQKKASEPSLTPNLSKARQRLYDTAIELGEIQSRFNVEIDAKEYANENLKFGLVEVVYEWAKGTPFVEICELTDVPEGIIVRTIVRLDETCREFKNAASIMGNCALYKKMEVASNAIRRDIVFAASLYITGV